MPFFLNCDKCNIDDNFQAINPDCGRCDGTGRDWRDDHELNFFAKGAFNLNELIQAGEIELNLDGRIQSKNPNEYRPFRRLYTYRPKILSKKQDWAELEAMALPKHLTKPVQKAPSYKLFGSGKSEIGDARIADYKDIDSYLNAMRTSIDYISDENNRFPSYVKVVHHILNDQEIGVRFVRSLDAKSELIFLGDESFVILDRQMDLYVNALKQVEIFNPTEGFEADWFSAYVFIAANHIHFLNRPELSLHLINTHAKGKPFTRTVDILGELSRLHFIMFHEWGHQKLRDDTEKRSGLIQGVEQQIDEMFGNLFPSHPVHEIFDDDFKEECAVDVISLIRAIDMMEADDLVSAGFGGISGYAHAVFQFLYKMHLIKEIKRACYLAIENRDFRPEKISGTLLRIRIIRQLFTPILAETYGLDKARDIFETFTAFSQKVVPLEDNYLTNLHAFIRENATVFTSSDAVYNEKCVQLFKWS